jgi:hypothetical protein
MGTEVCLDEGLELAYAVDSNKRAVEFWHCHRFPEWAHR